MLIFISVPHSYLETASVHFVVFDTFIVYQKIIVGLC